MSSITYPYGKYDQLRLDGYQQILWRSRRLIRDFSATSFLKNDRVGFVGTNGCGKTTLMKLHGRTGLEPDMRPGIKIGTDDKDRILFPGDRDESKKPVLLIWIRRCESLTISGRQQNLSGPRMDWSVHLPCWSDFYFRPQATVQS